MLPWLIEWQWPIGLIIVYGINPEYSKYFIYGEYEMIWHTHIHMYALYLVYHSCIEMCKYRIYVKKRHKVICVYGQSQRTTHAEAEKDREQSRQTYLFRSMKTGIKRVQKIIVWRKMTVAGAASPWMSGLAAANTLLFSYTCVRTV